MTTEHGNGGKPQSIQEVFREMQREAADVSPSPITRADSLSSPAGSEPSAPSVVGEHMPATIVTGKRGSSLLGAVAIASGAIHKDFSAEDFYARLSKANRDQPARVDSPKRIADTLRSIRNLKLTALRDFNFAPLIPPYSRKSDTSENMPLARVLSSLGQGSAVVLPYILRAEDSRKIRTGRAFWGAITGYWEEEVASPHLAPTIEAGVGGEICHSSVLANFTIGLALKDTPMRTVLPESELQDQLGYATAAFVVSNLKP